MSTKVYSPTENIFALLALDEPAQESKPTTAPKKVKAAPAKPSPNAAEPTPAARAEAKKQQEAELKAKQKADEERRAAQAAEAERIRKEKEEQQRVFDLEATGFAKQRSQRVKESKRPAPAATESWDAPAKTGAKPGKGRYNDGQKPAKDSESGAPNAAKPYKPREPYNKTVPQGVSQPREGQPGQGKRQPKREFDRQSGTGRGAGVKREGRGKANWDDGVAAGLAVASTPVANESPEAQSAAADVGGWSADFDSTPVVASTDATTPAEGETTKVDTDNAQPPADGEAKPEEPKVLTLAEYEALKEEKKKQLEALVGNSRQTRDLTDEEKQPLSKFTLIENSKVPKPKEVPANPNPKPVPTPAARKGRQNPVALDSVEFLKFQAPRPRRDDDRPYRAPRDVAREGQREGTNRTTGSPSETKGPRNTGAPKDGGPPRQKNSNFNPGAGRGAPRDNRARKGAPLTPEQFPTLR